MVVFILFGLTGRGGWIIWILSIIVYYFIGRTAAKSQYEQQDGALDPGRGVVAAAKGAALITCSVSWAFVIIRAIIMQILGYIIIYSALDFILAVIMDFLAAIFMGNWAGKGFIKSTGTEPEIY